MERGVPSQADYGGWESVVSSQAGVGNVFWRIFKATERSFLPLQYFGGKAEVWEGAVARTRFWEAIVPLTENRASIQCIYV